MSDYIFKFTDPSKPTFIVREFGANGPLIPSSALPLATGAVSAKTSLVIVGKGTVNYGDIIQSGVIHLLENFANSTPPAYPVEGQIWFKNNTQELYVYNSASWNSIVLSGASISPVDLNGQRITNLSNPLNANDAVSKSYADTTYLNTAGDTMTGFLVLVGDPTDPLHPTTKQYVDNEISVVANEISAVAGVGAGLSSKVTKTGDTMTGPLIMSNTAIQLTAGSSIQLTNAAIVLSGVSSSIDAGNTRISGVATPVNNTEAANKQYVDDASVMILNASHDVGVGSGETGILTLITDSAPIVLTDSPLAPYSHNHDSVDVIYNPFNIGATKSAINSDIAVTFSSNATTTNMSMQDAITALSNIVYPITHKTNRYISVGTGTTTMTMPFMYPVELDKLSIYKNGIKMYREERATGTLTAANPITLVDDSVVPSGIYAYNITIDGTLHTNVQVDLSNVPVGVGIYASNVDILRALIKSLGTPAYANVSFTVAPTLIASTGLVSGTLYGAVIVANGRTYSLVIDGSEALTFGDLFDAMYAQIPLVEYNIIGSDIKISTLSANSESTITVTDAPAGPILSLFASVSNYSAISSPTPGTTLATVMLHDGIINIMSPTVGNTSAIVLAAPSAGTNIFTSMGVTTSNQSITTTYDYAETGIPMRYSNSVTFTVATLITDKYEFIVDPYGLITDSSGLYV